MAKFKIHMGRVRKMFQIHLIKLEKLTIPKKFGGWGILNLFV